MSKIELPPTLKHCCCTPIGKPGKRDILTIAVLETGTSVDIPIGLCSVCDGVCAVSHKAIDEALEWSRKMRTLI